ncbi:hypothetical protein Scep_020482 [Stephania cephalantha]|uniref:Serine/threonine-protein phosphatase 2A 55 kDa regulatory subunit B n=1 Tax=Stephania cephalantha TaxID=152367 RepID=A0AAP0ICS1_9MAGN
MIPLNNGDSGVPSNLEWKFSQVFGERTAGEDVQEVDIISAIEFDKSGEHLATGDRGGRVVLFERTDGKDQTFRKDLEKTDYPAAKHPEFRYKTEFQSHEPEFDYLKSLEIEEKINKVRWCQTANDALSLLSTNDKTIKYWKVQEKKVKKICEMNLDTSASARNGKMAGQTGAMFDFVFPPGGFPALHLPVIVSHDTNLVPRCRRMYAHAHDYHINSISNNSDGETFISADDLRINLWNLEISNQSFNIVDVKPVNMEDLTGIFEEREAPGSRSFFTEIIASIADIKFGKDGRYILSRDYMTLKLWDLNMEASPVATFQVHEYLRPKTSDSGTNTITKVTHKFRTFSQKRLVLAKFPSHGFENSSMDANGGSFDFSTKLLHLAWHPTSNVLACAAANSLYMYYADDSLRSDITSNDDLRRPSGHSKQGGYQLSSEESSRGFASSSCREEEREKRRAVLGPRVTGGDGKYYAVAGVQPKSLSTRERRRGGHGSEQGRQHDVIVQTPVHEFDDSGSKATPRKRLVKKSGDERDARFWD